MQLNFYQTDDKAVSVLELSGRFDAYEVAPVNHWFDGLDDDAPKQVVIDLSGVTFIDSKGLATLVSMMKAARKSNGNVHLCGLQQQLVIIFELSKSNRVFKIFDTAEQAINAFPVTEV